MLLALLHVGAILDGPSCRCRIDATVPIEHHAMSKYRYLRVQKVTGRPTDLVVQVEGEAMEYPLFAS